ncbi:MAG: flagellar basal body rod protein FlgB [Lachnospiraceae bacterium]|nr:flagellar basal body rod protein FlgB [Lachnospiraceae bacterium]
MINSDIFNYVNVLDKAADASWTRNTVISNNLSNVDTPNYKRKDVAFQGYLQAALAGANTSTLNQRIANIELGSLNATSYTDMSNLSYRLDGNNVDVDTENVEYASNQIMYETLISSISNEFSMMEQAMQ